MELTDTYKVKKELERKKTFKDQRYYYILSSCAPYVNWDICIMQ